jgi:hypothetical protein
MTIIIPTPDGLPVPEPFIAEGPQHFIHHLPEGLPYPVDALGPLRAAVLDVQGATQAPLAIPAASALAVASLAVQGFCDVETLDGTSPTSLYMLTVGTSGERKSSNDRKVLRALRQFEETEAGLCADEYQAWKNSHDLWKGQREKILSEARTGKGEKRTAAQADLAALGKEPAAPASRDRTVKEPTFEGLTRKYVEGMPSLGLFSDEGGQFLGGFAMSRDNRQKTLAAFNDLWHGNPIVRTRAGEGSFTLYGRRFAMHLMVQPGLARDLFGDGMAQDVGFLARFLVCQPATAIGTRFQADRRDDGPAQAAFGDRLTKILSRDLPMDDQTRALTPRVLPLSPGARSQLSAFADRMERAQGRGQPYANATAAASKAAEQAARIAGVLTAWADLDAGEVTAGTMANGITLADYYLSESLRLTNAPAFSPDARQAEDLRKWLHDTWTADTLLPSNVQQMGPNQLRAYDLASRAIATLAKHGWLVALPDGSMVDGKSRKVAYRVIREKVQP